MNVLIGGTGFIGTALAEKLAQQGEVVVSISRSIPEQKVKGVVYHAIDVFSYPDQLIPILSQGATIFLLIGQNGSGFDVIQEFEGFSKVLNVVRMSVPEKVLFASTVLVYGECIEAAKENHDLVPKDAYAQFKILCEQAIQESLPSVPVAILRLANVYGSKKNKGFIGLVFKKILEGSIVNLNGDGLQERDYIFLDDVVSAMIAVKDQLRESDTINVASGKSETLLDVIDVIAKVTEKKVPYVITGISVSETGKSRVDNARLGGKYGFTPRVSFEEGINKAWERYNKEK